MRRLAFIALLSLPLAACDQGRNATDGAATIQDPEARRVYTAMLDAMGGEAAWNDARYFEFTFGVERDGQAGGGWTHHWDRWDGDYKLTGTRQGAELVVLMNVNQRDAGGRAWLDGQPVEPGARLDSLVQFAYGRWVNDSYWLIMPYKWTDPGVHAAYAGTRADSAGRQWEIVHLSFDQVGLTPQNEYDAWIDPTTGLMERWTHFRTADADPAIYDWNDWQQFGPIRLATRKPAVGGNAAIVFRDVRVETSVPADAFTAPG
jgi:hypothetical protein